MHGNSYCLDMLSLVEGKNTGDKIAGGTGFV
jgi:hypothetical protein